MLTEAFTTLSPRLAHGYEALLGHYLASSPELDGLHRQYRAYALRDTYLPRPVLAYFGYHAHSSEVDFNDLDHIGPGIYLAQLLRDFLAIHDDIVDEDLDKFGAPPLPVAMSATNGAALTKNGKDLALYYGDLLMGVALRVATDLGGDTAARVSSLLANTLYTNQRGQLAELLTETSSVSSTTVDDLLLIGERKAAHYCYAFPFALGAHLAGHDPGPLTSVRELLLRIGTASQVIDDLTGAFPGAIDHDKDTLGEIAHLRRTVPLVLLAASDLPQDIAALLARAAPLLEEEALALRDHMWASDVPLQALAVCEESVGWIQAAAEELPLGRAAHQYLGDLVNHRLADSLARLRASIAHR